MPPHPELVARFMAVDNMSAAQRQKLALQEVQRQYQRFDGDTGSSEVQVARLTQRIRSLADHMKVHRKDFHTRRGLEAVLARRRKLLTYLRSHNFDTYATLLTRLGLKDNYEKQDRLTLRLMLKAKSKR